MFHMECQAGVEGFKSFHKANISIFLFLNKDLALARQIQVILFKVHSHFAGVEERRSPIDHN